MFPRTGKPGGAGGSGGRSDFENLESADVISEKAMIEPTRITKVVEI
jgi:hypothetical protein